MISTAVVGAGLAGLVRAHALVRRGGEVLLLESSGRPGGVIRSERREGYLLELGPNTVSPTADLWRLLDTLGLSERALFADPRLPRYIDFGGRLEALPLSPGGLFSTRLLTAGGKLRLLTEPFRRRRVVAGETVEAFAHRRLGPQVARRIVAPFVSGIWAGDASRLVAAEAFPTLARWEREAGSLVRGALRQRRTSRAEPAPPARPRGLLSFPDGLEEIPRALATALGDRLHLRRPAREIERVAGGFRVKAGGDVIEAKRVVLAAPAFETARLVADLAPAAAAALDEVPYAPVTILHLSWPRESSRLDLTGFGHLVAPGEGRRILGAVWASSLFPGRAPQGRALLAVFLGGARDPEAAKLPEDELVAVARRDLEEQLGVRGQPHVVAVTRRERAIPQYVAGHRGRLEALERAERENPGLEFLGNYRGGISVADVVRNASVP